MIGRILALGLILASLSGCQNMGATEYGVRFRRMPRFLGGGVARNVVLPVQTVFVMPWESIYRFDTSVRDVSWGVQNAEEKRLRGPSPFVEKGYVHTRALDGNEVALAVTVRYRVSTDPVKLVRLVEEVATSDEEVRDLVIAVGRADIRHYMNELRTTAFLDDKSRYEAVDKVKSSMEERLKVYGIEVLRVGLDDFRFERQLRDGSIDASYQEKLTEIQKIREDTEREKSRIETVKAKKTQEFNIGQAGVNRKVAEAEGFKKQAELRGDGYLEARSNEAKGILLQGKAEVDGLIEQINALQGPGGEAILKMELAKRLMQGDPKFITLSGKGSNGLEVTRTDVNELIRAAGVFEGLREDTKGSKSTEDGTSVPGQ